MGLRQVFVSHTNDFTSSGGNNTSACPFITTVWTPLNAQAPIPIAGTFRKLRVRIQHAPGGVNSVKFTLQKNSADTGLSVTITGTEVEAFNDSTEVAFAVGDLIRLRRTHVAGIPTASYAQCSIEWEGPNDTDSIYGTNTGNNVAEHNRFNYVFNGHGDWQNVTSDNYKNVVPIPGTLTQMYAHIDGPVGAGNSITFTTYLNDIAQDGSGGTPDTRLTISGGSDTTGNTSFALPLVLGDLVHMQATYVGPTRVRVGYSYSFTSETPHRYLICGMDRGMTGGEKYGAPQAVWDSDWGNPESPRAESIAGGGDFTIFGIVVRLQVAPGASTIRVFRLRKNLANTALEITVQPTDTLVFGGVEVDITSGDVLSLQHVSVGLPINTSRIWYSLVGGVEEEASPGGSPEPEPTAGVIGPLVWIEFPRRVTG